MGTLPQWKRLPSWHSFDPKWGLDDDSPSTPLQKLKLSTTSWPAVQRQIVMPSAQRDTTKTGKETIFHYYSNRTILVQ